MSERPHVKPPARFHGLIALGGLHVKPAGAVSIEDAEVQKLKTNIKT